MNSFLDRNVKEPRCLKLFIGGVYQFTYNDTQQHVFTQSRLAILIDMPSAHHNFENFVPFEIWMAPPATKSPPPVSDRNHVTLHALGWRPVKIGACPGYTQTHEASGTMAKRKQYGLRPFIVTTVHAIIGTTLRKLAIGVSRSNPDLSLWDPGMAQVAISRTNKFSDMIWVGNKEDILNGLIDVLLQDDILANYVDDMIDRLSINPHEMRDNNATEMWNTVAVRNAPYSITRQPLPCDNSGFVYMLISIKTLSTLYIGQTHDLVHRIRLHNDGFGAKQTRSIRDKPWGLLAYVCGFQGDKKARVAFEKRWQVYARLNRKTGDRSMHGAIRACTQAFPEFLPLHLKLVHYGQAAADYSELIIEHEHNNRQSGHSH